MIRSSKRALTRQDHQRNEGKTPIIKRKGEKKRISERARRGKAGGKLSPTELFPERENPLSQRPPSSGGKSIWAFSRARIYLIILGDGGRKPAPAEWRIIPAKLSRSNYASRPTDRCPGRKYNSPVLLNIDPAGNWNFRPSSYFRLVSFSLSPVSAYSVPGSFSNPFYSRIRLRRPPTDISPNARSSMAEPLDEWGRRVRWSCINEGKYGCKFWVFVVSRVWESIRIMRSREANTSRRKTRLLNRVFSSLVGSTKFPITRYFYGWS